MKKHIISAYYFCVSFGYQFSLNNKNGTANIVKALYINIFCQIKQEVVQALRILLIAFQVFGKTHF